MMDPEQEKQRDKILEHMKQLAGELWMLVQPTPAEQERTREFFDDRPASYLCDLLVLREETVGPPQDWVTGIMTCLDVMIWREHPEEELHGLG